MAELKNKINVEFDKEVCLSRGENPEQEGAYYSQGDYGTFKHWVQYAGGKSSFNNIREAVKMYGNLKGFEDTPVAVTGKHGEISGIAGAPTIEEAYVLAHSTDIKTHLGSVTMVNRKCTNGLAKLVGKTKKYSKENENYIEKYPHEEIAIMDSNDWTQFTEVLGAPKYTRKALEILRNKQVTKIRAFQTQPGKHTKYDIRMLDDDAVIQTRPDYSKRIDPTTVECVTKESIDDDRFVALMQMGEIVRKVNSNGIVIGDGTVKNGEVTRFWTYGAATEKRRSFACEMAVRIANEDAERSYDALCASDGFFPHRDNIDTLGQAGIKAVLVPHGGRFEKDVIKAADEYGLAMYMHNQRLFSH